MSNPPRSCDRLEDGHKTALIHRTWQLSPIYDELLLPRDRRQGDHVTSEDYTLRPEETCEMHAKDRQQTKLKGN